MPESQCIRGASVERRSAVSRSRGQRTSNSVRTGFVGRRAGRRRERRLFLSLIRCLRIGRTRHMAANSWLPTGVRHVRRHSVRRRRSVNLVRGLRRARSDAARGCRAQTSRPTLGVREKCAKTGEHFNSVRTQPRPLTARSASANPRRGRLHSCKSRAGFSQVVGDVTARAP